jgi:copper chaperone CopZ
LQLSALKISDYQTDEEAIKTLKAATEGRYNDAMNLEKVLQLLKTAGFASDKASIDALAALNPNIKFTDNLDDIKNALKALIEGKYTINIGATITMPAIPGITNGGTVTAKPDPSRVRKYDEDTSKDLEPGKPPVVRPPYIDLPGEQAGEPFKRPFVPDLGSFRFFEENEDSSLRNLYDKTSVPSNFDVSSSRYFEETGRSARGMATPSFFDPAGFRARDEGVTINVNVQGSVVAQNDLVAAVTDAVYATQRTGNNILLEGI